mmetsp:Transcript_15175/g.17186  ORF Transcript_15175/g.17186 Transcript_15175/m.17186 type:complete len:216 (-) Transcript_15175:129-776(-)
MCNSLNLSSVAVGVKRCRAKAFSQSVNVDRTSSRNEIRERAFKLHKKHGAVSKADVSKWLTSEVIKAEKSIHRMFGAVGYAEVQLQQSIERKGCVLCRRKFRCRNDVIKFNTCFRKKIGKTVDFVLKSQANELRLKYTSQLEKLKAFPENGFVTEKPIVQYKLGKIDALRTQKTDTLQQKRCSLCERKIKTNDFPRFLSFLDRRINNLQKEIGSY